MTYLTATRQHIRDYLQSVATVLTVVTIGVGITAGILLATAGPSYSGVAIAGMAGGCLVSSGLVWLAAMMVRVD